jgi:DNA-binding response OmpR family regulator
MLVLICEDEGLLASEMEAIAGEAGAAVAGIARTAGEARRIAQASRPDVAVIDLHLGDGRSGPELAAELAGRGMRIVVVSADTAVDPLLARIGHVFLAKPINPAMLRDLLSDAAASQSDIRVAAA